VEGIKQVCAPDPTDPQAVGKLVSANKCTILFATSTFANIYARSPKIKAEDFSTLRYVVLGAEKLREEVRTAFESKFMKTMYEGYGTTECSPVVSVNLPDFMNRKEGVIQKSNIYGSVGQCLPGTCAMVIDPDTEENLGFDQDGLLIVTGPQIMKGYYNLDEKTAQVLFEKDGQTWYKTGDKARISGEGFIKIVDRYSRFAKIGGEMISLAMVEDHLLQLIGDAELELSAVALPDANRGEIIALLVSNLKAEVEELTSKIQHSDLHAMYRPRKILKVSEIPKLGSGKTDFTATKRLAQSMMHA
jgi:acyl-[acyl-carrier-protein]-phospholipid O-acyltransferase/long-chain-fatty-acid--[acyl-carrier-protein] ligase